MWRGASGRPPLRAGHPTVSPVIGLCPEPMPASPKENHSSFIYHQVAETFERVSWVFNKLLTTELSGSLVGSSNSLTIWKGRVGPFLSNGE